MAEQSPETGTDQDTEAPSEPMNRAERRAMKKGKGKSESKGVRGDTAKSGFNPKHITTTGHKEFTNRKSG